MDRFGLGLFNPTADRVRTVAAPGALRAAGVTGAQTNQMLVDNPPAVLNNARPGMTQPRTSRPRGHRPAPALRRHGGGMARDHVRAGPAESGGALGRARGDRWLPTPPVTAIDEAAAYLDRVGFAVLFPAEGAEAPSLWEAVAGPEAVPFAAGMGPAESQVWTWKDQLPKAGLAWYGKFVYKGASLLTPRLLTALYAGHGEPTDHEAFDLPDEAHRIAEALVTGPAVHRRPTRDRRQPRSLRPGDDRVAAPPAGDLGRCAREPHGWPSTLMRPG